MFSQLTRYASELNVQIDEAEMDLRTQYDQRTKLGLATDASACLGVTYVWTIESPEPVERVLEVLRKIERGCHTTNSLKQPVPVTGKLRRSQGDLDIIV